MNKNEECLLKFLGHPGRLDKTIGELERFIFTSKDNIINPKEFQKNIKPQVLNEAVKI